MMTSTRTKVLPEEQVIHTILVYGAGVLGSLYAGKLQQAGCAVTLLARGKRLEELRTDGLRLVRDGSRRVEIFPMQLTDELKPADAFDLILVIVRKNQLSSVLPALAANTGSKNVLFLVNNADGPGILVDALGSERVLLGFPGAGGERVDGVVHYRVTPRIVQPTTIGELDGRRSERIVQIARVLSRAGFPVAVSANMDAWLKTHVAVVSPVANALYLAGGSNYRLAHTRDGLVLMVRAVKEGLRVLEALRVPITPAKYRALLWLPEPLLVAALKAGFDTRPAELVLARHANSARDEMQALADELRALVRRSGLATPAMDALYCYLDPHYPALPAGQAEMSTHWGAVIAAAGGLAALGLALGWFQRRQKHPNN